MNFVPARLEEDKLRLPFGDAPIPRGRRRPSARDVIAGIRPEHFEDAAIRRRRAMRLKAKLDVVESMGSELYVYFDDNDDDALRPARRPRQGLDDAARGTWSPGSTPRAPPKPAARSTSSLDTSQIKLFDPDSGRALNL